MEVSVSEWGEKKDPRYRVDFTLDSTKVTMDYIERKELDEFGLDVFDQTVLYGIGYHGVMDKLLGLGIIDEDQIQGWISDRGIMDD